MTEEEMEKLENEFPPLAAAAFSEARKQALEAGLSVVEAEGDELVRVFPVGAREFIKKLSPRLSIAKGSILIIPPAEADR